MAKALIMLTALSVILIAGCVHSINGAYTEEAGTFDPALVGVWQPDNAQDTWEFLKAGDHAYSATLTDGDGLSGMFDVMMFEAGGFTFLDFYPAAGEEQQAHTPYYDYHFMPMHTFMLVRQVEPALVLSLPDPDWIGTYLTNHPDAVAHAKGEVMVLTDQPEAVQKFLGQIAGMEDSFHDSEPMQKM